MALSIILGEDQLRSMPADLREALLTWYFDRPPRSVPDRAEPLPTSAVPPQAAAEVEVSDASEDVRRITFPELARARLLRPGYGICCRALKRQQRSGVSAWIEGATVSGDGRVEFRGEKFSSPSKLAKAMVNANGGKTPALNGYDYLFVQTGKGLVRLDQLREKLVSPNTFEEEAAAQTLMETGAFGDKEEALNWARENRFPK